MRIIFAILSLFIFRAAEAQDFAHTGTRWIYNDLDTVSYQNYPRTIISVADTVINGTACYLVIGDCACGTSQTNYVYAINRRVYWYHFALGDFALLYDFNLNQGETWNIVAQNSLVDSLTLRVDSVTFDTLNNQIRKVQHVSAIAVHGFPYVFEGPVIEGIGSLFCLYPQSYYCDPITEGLRCYEDSTLGFYDTHFASFCEEVFVDSGIGVGEIEHKIRVTFSPNPLQESGVIRIENTAVINGILVITDASGRKVSTEKFSGNTIVIQRNRLEAGIYFFHLISDHAIGSGKFIIE